jgi:myo-inositol-1(or 4)-monophosphatase
MPHPLLNIAITAARKAGNIIIRALDRPETLKVSMKSQNDFVTEIDQLAEKAIIEIIHKNYPSHGICGEESGLKKGDAFTWIIDPLDGTTNFIHGFPHFAVSIAVQHKDKIEHAVIYDPVRQELFSASRGQGAKLDQYRMRVTQTPLQHALLGTGFPYKAMDNLEPYLKEFAAFTRQAVGIRRAGSAALDLAYVAAGRLDGFWEYGLAPWDIAAGSLLVLEAGGSVAEPNGQGNYLESGNIVAANAGLLEAMLRVTEGQTEGH